MCSGEPVLLEKDLEPQPEKVRCRREMAGSDRYRVAELRMLPVEENACVKVEVPVQADIRRPHVIGPEVGIGKTSGEDVSANIKRAESCVDLPCSRVERPSFEELKVEVTSRLDDVYTSRELLAGEEVRRGDVISRKIDRGRRGAVGKAVVARSLAPTVFRHREEALIEPDRLNAPLHALSKLDDVIIKRKNVGETGMAPVPLV